MTNPPNYKILHIQPCEYTPTPPTPTQTSSSESEDNRDMSVLQFQIFHLLRLNIQMENGRFYSYDHPRLTRITTPVKEIETSVLLLGNSYEIAARDMSRTLSSLEIPENCHAEIIERISQIGGITTKNVCNDQVVADHENEAIMQMQTVETVSASRSCIKALEKVRLGEMEEVKQRFRCSICLKEYQVGLEVTRLPCSHVYHPDCIVKWLETSPMCPLCRQPVPL
ncbi:hypothetical protein JRO89_XS13G0174700 [Xanthoceras sorbifolium]|uniref:RING-type E3 ubiquitin transferase n=1 Tax=Xanthoceras sorbifolium TaxID=99658 RepID=A0ABQ8H8U4_9ROSI|nr:hypothetical protein JRO89_XS13G0174700 [Xanthoceras sorbifolium]